MLEYLLRPEIQDLIKERDFAALRDVLVDFAPSEIAYLFNELNSEEVVLVFRLLPRDLANDTFAYLAHEYQELLVESLAHETDRLANLLNELPPDDRTAFLEELPGSVSQRLLAVLTPEERRIASKLLGYPEDSVGRLMTPDYVAVRPEWTVGQSLEHIRRYGKDSETLNVVYVVDDRGFLLDDLKIRHILLASPDAHISDVMDGKFVALKGTDDQEMAVHMFRQYDAIVLPVTDTKGVLIGIVTVDDVLDVAAEEATEDIQKFGGSDALAEPYLKVRLLSLVRSRAKWLIVLFLGEILTATAMGYFEEEIARAVVLAMFVPLIISSGGNSGSQAATLIIRAMALGEVRLRDWWRVMRREILSGLALGSILGVIGVLRVWVWEVGFQLYGEHWLRIGLTVGISLVGVVLWGTLSGSMLPFVLRRIGADPAVSSAPFVATLVDVTGIIIYFSVAAALLRGSLL